MLCFPHFSTWGENTTTTATREKCALYITNGIGIFLVTAFRFMTQYQWITGERDDGEKFSRYSRSNCLEFPFQFRDFFSLIYSSFFLPKLLRPMLQRNYSLCNYEAGNWVKIMIMQQTSKRKHIRSFLYAKALLLVLLSGQWTDLNFYFIFDKSFYAEIFFIEAESKNNRGKFWNSKLKFPGKKIFH